MRIRLFQSDKGDCLLLTSQGGRRILVDGGMKHSYSAHTASRLARLAKEDQKLDLVYVSHIDQDHISGILQLMDDIVAWKVHQFHLDNGNPSHPRPANGRPPFVSEIWHNAFHEQLGKNAGAIEDMLAATATVLAGSTDEDLLLQATTNRELATSVRQAIQLSRRIGNGQLNIPLNAKFQRKLALVPKEAREIPLGDLKIRVIGPFEKDLKKLRKLWNQWLRENEDALKEIAKAAREESRLLQTDEVSRVIQPALLQAKVLGNRKKVTPANLASLMLLVEEEDLSVLLTGDGHSNDILAGLEHHQKLTNGRIHVDVLKVQHHGSEHNIEEEFCRRVTADHYLFCGDGAHHNPDLDVIRLIAESRLENGDGSRFKFWFNNSSAVAAHDSRRKHMKEAEELVRKLAGSSGGRLRFRFLTRGSSLLLKLP